MGKRITSLTEITTVTENDYIPVDNAATGARKLSADFINDLEDEIDGKQDALTPGANIEIAQDGTISATDTTYTAGTNVDITNGVISATDTTYTAGTNITITNGEISATDTDTDALSELTDTAISSPSDGDALVYDSTSGKWVNGGVASDINDLNDVDITTPTDGQVLSYDATSQEWVNTDAGSDVSVTQIQSSGTKIATVTVDNVDTDLYAPTPTEVVANPSGTGSTDLTKIDVGGTIYNIPTGGSGSSTLAGLTDVDLDTPTDGQGLVYDATNQKWVNDDVGGGSLTAVEMDYEDWLALPQSEREDPTIEYFLSNAPGGGGGGASDGFEEVILYEAPDANWVDITVDWDWDDYDFYVFRVHDAITSSQGGDTSVLTKQQISDLITNSAQQPFYRGGSYYATYTFGANQITRSSHNTFAIIEIVGCKSGGGGTGDLSAMELTQNQYNNLPTAQKLDDKELYFVNNNITTEEAMDVTDFVNKVESGGAMTITADETNNTLTYVWGGAATIGANSFYPTVIPSDVTRIDYKITTGTSYTTSDDQFKIGIGVKTTYDAANWAKPTDNNWVAIDTYNTQNTVIEGSLDLSEVDEDTYFYICGHGWNMTIEDLTIVTVNESTDPTKIMYKDVEYSGANNSASLYKWYTSNDGTITVRTGPDGTYWFFNGFNTDGGGSTFVNIPSELAQFAPTNTEPQLSEAYSDPSGSTVGWIGFYVNTIRGWNPAKSANLFTTLYGVVKADGANEQHNGYFSAYKGIPNSGGISYSTAEQVIGTWVDGKPIYELTIAKAVNFPGSNTWKTLGIAMSTYNIKQIFDVTIVGTENTNNVPALLHPESVEPINGDICVYHNFNWNMTSSHIILRYTKTTD